MVTVDELRKACEKIGNEFGWDSKVCIQVRNEDGSLLNGDYYMDICLEIRKSHCFLSRYKFKHGNCE